MEYNIYLTNDCNLGCDYCSVLLDCKKYDIPIVPQYSNELLADFIRRTAEQCHDPNVMLFLFGGEPTLEYQLTADCVAYLKNNLPGLNFYPILHTNGLLLNQIPAGLLADLALVMLSVNYERIPHHQLSPGYFSTIIDNALGLKNKRPDLPLVGRFTITEKTSLFTETVMCDRFFDLIHWQLENAPALRDFDSFYAAYTYDTALLFETWVRRMEEGVLLKYIPFMVALKYLLHHDRDDNLFCCGYDRHMIFVQTDGRCYACCDGVAEGIHRIGDLERGIAFKGFKLTDFRCGDCDYRPLCMGRCGRMHREFSPERIDEYCRLNKFMYDLFLKEKDRLRLILEARPDFLEQLSGWIPDVMEQTP